MLPAELRIEIYRHILHPSDECSQSRGYACLKGGFHPILHVCRRIRAEVIPMFFGNNTATVHLRDIKRKKSIFKHEGFYDILDERAIACLRWIRIKYHSECSDHGPWNFGNVSLLIDRVTGKVNIDSQSSFASKETLHEGCQDAWLVYIDRLIGEIKAKKLNTWGHHLCKADFDELANLRESRPCQMKPLTRMVRRQSGRGAYTSATDLDLTVTALIHLTG